MARLKVEQPPASHGVLVVDIPFFGEEDNRVEPSAIPPSQELVMIRSSHDTAMARSTSESGATYELVWPCPDEMGKAWFILRDKEEVKLWHLLEERGLSMEPDLALTKVRLKEALERVELVHQAMIVNLPHVAEVNSLHFWCCP